MADITHDLMDHLADGDELERVISLNRSWPTEKVRNDDTLMVRPLRPPLPEVDESVLVRAQNVHDYFERHYREHKWNDLTSFTCVKLPYKRIVITYDHEFLTPHDKSIGLRHVDMVVTEQTPEWFLSNFPENTIVHDSSDIPIDEFIERAVPASMLIFTMYANTSPLPGSYALMIDERGQVITYRNTTYFYLVTVEEEKLIEAHGKQFAESIANGGPIKMQGGGVIDGSNVYEWFRVKCRETYGHHTAIALATIQFMHCRNVEIVDHHPTRQQRRHAEREGKRPPVTYKTLVIHPIGKRYLHRQSVRGGDEMPLHICRGHFKDYRCGKGLGKWHRRGIWWWEAQVRGSAERGRVVKDYEVENS